MRLLLRNTKISSFSVAIGYLEQDLLELNGHVKSVTNSFERAS